MSKLTGDGKAMLFGTATGELIEWQLGAASVRRLASFGSAVHALDTHASSWVVGLADGSLRVGSRSQTGEGRSLGKHSGEVEFVAFGASGTQVISRAASPSAPSSQPVVARDATSGAEIRRWDSPSNRSPAVSADGRRLAYVAPTPGGLSRWEIVDLASGRTENRLGDAGTVPDASSFSRSGDLVVTRTPGALQSFVVWSPSPARRALHFRGPPAFQGPSSLATSPDGGLLALAEEYDRVTLWDTRDMHLVGSLDGAPGSAEHLAFSPDSALIYATTQGSVWLWRVKERRLVAEITVTQRGDALCALSPDGRVQVIGSGVPECAACRVGPFALPVEACPSDPKLLSGVVPAPRGP